MKTSMKDIVYYKCLEKMNSVVKIGLFNRCKIHKNKL